MFTLKKQTADDEQAVATAAFDYEIVRSVRRRSISIEVRQARVVVRAAKSVPAAELHQFVSQKHAWIVQKIAAQQQHIASLPQRIYRTGHELPFCGQSLILHVESATAGVVEQLDDNLIIRLSRRSRLADEDQARRLVCGWYQQQALALLTQRTEALTAQMGLRCGPVTVKSTRSKWGHCTSRGAIQYNWHIILAPAAIVDYLVAHEVCHLRHPNHSPAYWQLVEQVCPTYRADRAWLKTHGAKLIL